MQIGWVLCLWLAFVVSVLGADWPQWGGHDTRQMIADETNLPDDFAPGEKNADNTAIDMATTRNVK